MIDEYDKRHAKRFLEEIWPFVSSGIDQDTKIFILIKQDWKKKICGIFNSRNDAWDIVDSIRSENIQKNGYSEEYFNSKDGKYTYIFPGDPAMRCSQQYYITELNHQNCLEFLKHHLFSFNWIMEE